jgi:hypothetical protein
MPGTSRVNWYAPVPSATVLWSPPMTPGLESVTVVPGITAPDSSLTVPPIDPTPCARAGGDGVTHNNATSNMLRTTLLSGMALTSR